MKHLTALTTISAFVTALLLSGAAHAADTPTPPKGFDAFRFVKARNIFDPDRRGMPSAPSARPAAPPRPNFINLTGTMVADGKMLAFFSGSRTEFSKVISVGDSIADFKITGITNTQVELDHSGKQIVVAVGKPVPLEGSSAAIPLATAPSDSDAAALSPDAPATGTPASDTPAATDSKPADSKPAGAPADDKNEVLRRMMERRAKELSK